MRASQGICLETQAPYHVGAGASRSSPEAPNPDRHARAGQDAGGRGGLQAPTHLRCDPGHQCAVPRMPLGGCPGRRHLFSFHRTRSLTPDQALRKRAPEALSTRRALGRRLLYLPAPLACRDHRGAGARCRAFRNDSLDIGKGWIVVSVLHDARRVVGSVVESNGREFSIRHVGGDGETHRVIDREGSGPDRTDEFPLAATPMGGAPARLG